MVIKRQALLLYGELMVTAFFFIETIGNSLTTMFSVYLLYEYIDQILPNK